jgi:hypothetical protein
MSRWTELAAALKKIMPDKPKYGGKDLYFDCVLPKDAAEDDVVDLKNYSGGFLNDS